MKLKLKCTMAMGMLSLTLAAGNAKSGVTQSTYDFENQPATSNGGLTSLSLTNNGLTVTIDRVGQSFDTANISSLGSTSVFGQRTLAPTPPGTNFFNVNFSQPVSNFSVQMGDFGTNVSDSLSLTAFAGPNGTGANLGTSSATLPLTSASTMSFTTLQISKPGIESVQYTGGTSGDPNSVFSDNYSATTNPTGNNGAGGTTSVPL
ncbi:MAG TPA: hypothetical protein VFC78_23900, partial [Tepidisphaeraceae bacterium]|nr:hypothetical protein [Tepidisphaeraceae bacterium]